MKKTKTINRLLITAALIATVFHGKDSFAAAGDYYLEIGTPASEERANAQWEILSTKYKSLLGGLKFYPGSIVGDDGTVGKIIRAGSISDKEKAEQICDKLFAVGIPCFVIEGIEEKPPTISVGVSLIASDPSKRAALFPWQTEENALKELTDGNIRQHTGQADIEVAEAIPVPLTGGAEEESKITEPSQPQEVTAFPGSRPFPWQHESSEEKNVATGQFSEKPEQKSGGSLIIHGFSDKNEARAFWKQAAAEHSDLTKNLKVRLQRPLSGSEESGVRLRIFPFDDNEDAASFCNETTADNSNELKCAFEPSPARQKRNIIITAPSEPEQEHNIFAQRRAPAAQTENVPESGSIFVRDLSGKNYWAQIAIADSKEEAGRRWTEIRRTAASAIKDISGQIVRSASGYAKYAVRLGAFDSEAEANDICNKLQAKAVDCLTVSTIKDAD